MRAVHRSKLVVGLVVAVVLSACGGGSETDDAGASPSANAPSGESVAGLPNAIRPLDLSSADPSQLSDEERAELDALFPDDPAGTAHYLVELNPAAVTAEVGRSARVLSADAAHAHALAVVRSQADRLGSGHGARIKAVFGRASKGFAVSVPHEQALAYLNALAVDPAVVDIQLDRVVKPSVAPWPRDVSAVWGLDRIDEVAPSFDKRYAPYASGEGVKVFVIDTGIRATHQEFQGRSITSVNLFGGANTDCFGHGTHVAGTIGGKTYGVAPDVTLVAVKVFGCSGGASGSTIIQGMEHVLSDSHPRRVVNMSLGGGYSAYENSIVQKLVDQNVVVVMAAGNSGADACNFSPASAAAGLTVAATQRNDQLASFSNYGKCVDVAAPGTEILSASYSSDSGSTTLQGTSMASPHVAGVAALLWEANPSATAAEIIASLPALASTKVVGLGGAKAATPNKLLFAGSGTKTVPQIRAVHVEEINAHLQNTGPTTYLSKFTVRVADGTSRSVQGAKVKAYVSNSNQPYWCTTLTDGTCTITAPQALVTKYRSVTLSVADVVPASTPSAVVVRDASADRVVSAVAKPVEVSAHLGNWTTTKVGLSNGRWQGSATLRVLDGDNKAVAGAYVYVRSNGAVAKACLTSVAGECTLSTGVLQVASTPQYTFEVTSIEAPGLTYQRAANTSGAGQTSIDFLPRRYAGVQSLVASPQYANAARTFWNARITVGLKRGDGAAASGLTVSGRWSSSTATVSCKTGATGSCVLTAPNQSRTRASDRFVITAVSAYSTYYDTSLNEVSEVTVTRP